MVDDQPYEVIDFQYVKPGKGQAFTRVKIKNVTVGTVLERSFKSGEKLEAANVEERRLQYISPEGSDFVFMDPATGEQLTISGEMIGNNAKQLSDGLEVEVTILRGKPISVRLPP